MKQAGQQLGVSAATIYNWEHHHSVPALRLVPAIAGFLGYDPAARPESLGERLRRHRQLHGWTQKEFARLLQVDPGTLARWERDEGRPTETLLRRLEELLPAAPLREGS